MGDEEVEDVEAPVQLARQTAAALREMILSGELLPGQKIHQVDVARQLGVSRSPLREALRTLEGEGLARYETNRGYVVTRLNMDELAEILQLRDVIEAHLISHISAPDEKTLSTLRGLTAEIEAAVTARDFDALTSAVRQSRVVIYELSHLPIFLSELQRLWKMTDLYTAQHMMPPAQRVIKDHRGIVASLAAGDLATARKLLLGLRQLNDRVIVGLPRMR
jgi:DNA-binding GntR family transcriptional regulator